MSRALAALLAVACLLAARPAPAASAALTPWTTGDVLALRTVTDPQLSPDGRWVAYVVASLTADRAAFQTDVWLASVSGGEARQLTRSPVADESPRWSPDGRTLAFLSDRPRPAGPAGGGFDEGRRQIWMMRVDGGEASPVSNAPCGVLSFAWSHDGKSLAYLATEPKSEARQQAEREHGDAWTPNDRLRMDRLWLLDLASDTSRVLTPPELEAVDYSFSPDDRTLVVALQPSPRLDDMLDTDLYLVPAAGGPLTPLVRRPGSDSSPRWSPDGKWIAFTSHEGRAHGWFLNNAVCIVPAAGGEPHSITRGFDECVDGMGAGGLCWLPDSRAVVFFALQRTNQHLMRAGLDGTVRALTSGDGMNESPSVAGAGACIAYLSQDAEHPCEVWALPAGGKPRRVTDTNPETRARPAFRKTLVRWRAADGREIEGLLVLPQGVPAGQRVPLVLLVHGGPGDAFGNTCTAASKGFPLAQWAQQGWAILMPNPRGSGGYGEAFRAANQRDWGGKDYADLMCGVDAMIARGVADSTRLVACGWSYGGFLTATIVTKTQRFRAAVVGAGMSDLAAMSGTCDIPDFDRTYFGAWPWEDARVYVDHSPLFHVRDVKTPTLVVHGELDDRVPTSQGFEFYGALQKAGVPSELVVLPRTGHVPHEPRLLGTVQERLLEWCDRWTRTPAPAPAH